MAKKDLPSADVMRQLLDYDPETGLFVWKCRPVDMFVDGKRTKEQRANVWNGANAGKYAFTADNNGYKVGTLFTVFVKAHHAAWLIMTGEVPVDGIDHINGDKADNRWCNLREVEHTINMRNTPMRRTNTSGHNGVRYDKRRSSWYATMQVDGKTRYLGRFSTKEDAAAARKHAEVGFGYTERHGKAVT